MYFSAYTDSDTGFLDDPKSHKGRKTRRKRTTNLGPRLKVLKVNNIESGLKVECQMETAKQKTITFEFSTVDFVPEDISNEFVKKDLLPQQHRDILIEQLNDIVRQLNEDSTKIPIVHFPTEQLSSSSPNRADGAKKAVGSDQVLNEQSSLPSSPAKTATAGASSGPPPLSESGEVKKSRFTILPISASGNQTPDSQSPGVVQQAPVMPPSQHQQGTPQTGQTPDSTIQRNNVPLEK